MNVPGADYYDRNANFFHGKTMYYHHALKFFKPEAGESIIDLGCGTGGNIIKYGKKGHPITGIEFSRTLLDIGKRTLLRTVPHPKRRENIHFIHSTIEDFQTSDRWDWALCTEVLEHVKDPVEVLRKAKQLASSVYVSAPSIKIGGPGHVRGVSVVDLSNWLKEAGYSQLEVFEKPAVRIWHGQRADTQTIGIAHVPH